MKKKLIITIAFLVVFITGCFVGSCVQYLKSGYHHKTRRTKSFPFRNGEVTLKHITESIGMPFLDPETSVITVQTECGLPIIVYKAKRVFQESCPHVEGVKIDTNQVTWQDGINSYQLAITPIEEKAEQGCSTLPRKLGK